MLIERIRTFCRRTDGGVTIEYVVWLPLFCGILMLAANVTMLFHHQQLLYDAVRDASRQVAVGRSTEAAAAQMMRQRLPGHDVSVLRDGDFVTSRISVPFDAVMVFAGHFVDGQLTAQVSMWVETPAASG